ncbi:NAD-dependent epimerase/dehydratase family protein [Vibrio sp. Isolate34]|uniref:NAD-dependent epimerase/dehydratase family protein n=1 Tax=Vibrio sp. Isolate34 TaxID=2908540 RepID=UPI001EFEE846|nr:NAD-dependent epimerase/dehydratase family protein [Vibrio sp. Isolate34]MCG9639538.1 NAD-dependent epimerase/dehydratase family protein [Vibrio sp. Isolate34]
MVLVTGGNGFIGKELVTFLQNDFTVRTSVRQLDGKCKALPPSVETVVTGDISDKTNWNRAIDGVDVVIHLAGRAHILDDTALSPIDLFREVNTKATLHLFDEAVKNGVRRFIFVSSIGVTGNITHGKPFTEQDSPEPASDYALSKYEAEKQLTLAAAQSDIELVIIRPALVYGKSAPGNIARLSRIATKCPFLPFGLVANRKSFVSIENLVSLLALCITHPAASNQVFLAADTTPVSTKQLVNILSKVEETNTINFPFPVALMRMVAALLGKKAMASQLFDDLEVDNTKARKMLGWKPCDGFDSIPK